MMMMMMMMMTMMMTMILCSEQPQTKQNDVPAGSGGISYRGKKPTKIKTI
jgi:hypothetical protein